MTINPEIVLAIMAILGIGVIGIIELIKRIFKTEGKATINFIIAGIVSLGSTAFYFYQAGDLTLWNVVLYGAIVFGEATGLYHVFRKA